MKIALVCSPGGHFLQLYSLKDFWQDYDHFWITAIDKDNLFLLGQDRVYRSYQPTNRSIVNLFRNFFLAIRVLLREKPNVIISEGAGIAVPFIYAGWLLKIKTVYLESVTRVDTISLAGRLVYPVADHFIVQWPELAKKYKKARFEGNPL